MAVEDALGLKVAREVRVGVLELVGVEGRRGGVLGRRGGLAEGRHGGDGRMGAVRPTTFGEGNICKQGGEGVFCICVYLSINVMPRSAGHRT